MSDAPAPETAFKQGDRVEILGLKAKPQYNGRVGSVIGYHRSKGRYAVILPPDNVSSSCPKRPKLNVRPVNLKLASKEKAGVGFPVYLWVYDLSNGMAKTLSKQLIGKQIDGVWHTGLVVYGYEYYFGGGIQGCKPGSTQAGNPVKKLPLGTTYVSQASFHAWLRSESSKYTPKTYDLIKHNCNNFSDAASNFLIGKSIPSYITGLTSDVLSTPMGKFLQPMLSNLHNQHQAAVPWADGELSLPPLGEGKLDENEEKHDSEEETKKEETGKLEKKEADLSRFAPLMDLVASQAKANADGASGAGVTQGQIEALAALAKKVSRS